MSGELSRAGGEGIDDTTHQLFYSSYVQTYLQRDVRDLAQVGDKLAFLRFLRACATRTGQLLNMTDLARDADVHPNTAKNWLPVLKASGLIWLLQPWHSNVTKRLVKPPQALFLGYRAGRLSDGVVVPGNAGGRSYVRGHP